ISMAVVPVEKACGQGTRSAQTSDFRLQTFTSGPWAHVEPPRTLPSWIDCGGFNGVLAYSHRRVLSRPDEDTHLLVRALAFPDSPRPGYAVVVDLLVNDSMREQLRKDTGVELRSVVAAPNPDEKDARPLRGRDGGDEQEPI